MLPNASNRKRWGGGCALVAALMMLFCGETLLKGRLGDLAFVIYWMGCWALTSVAILLALLDARAVRQRTRQEQRELFETTLQQIQTEAKKRSHQRDRRKGGKQPGS